MTADPFPGIAAFVRAAEARSFTAAARLLGVTPSAISKAVSRLEAELGVRLFNRGRREVALTGDGEDFFRQCRHLVHAAEDARAGLAGGGREARGTLRACVPISFGQFVVGPALSGWLAHHPGVKVELMLTDRYADLGEERLDLAMRLG
ncbi:MAG: LysR family transcriptional regulator, partial [Thauera sp.]